MLNSLTICLFARKVYDRDTIIKAFEAIDVPMTNEDLDEVAKRVYAVKLRIKKALNFDINQIKLPKRFFKTPAIQGVMSEDIANEMMLKYRERIQGMEEYV